MSRKFLEKILACSVATSHQLPGFSGSRVWDFFTLRGYGNLAAKRRLFTPKIGEGPPWAVLAKKEIFCFLRKPKEFYGRLLEISGKWVPFHPESKWWNFIKNNRLYDLNHVVYCLLINYFSNATKSGSWGTNCRPPNWVLSLKKSWSSIDPPPCGIP